MRIVRRIRMFLAMLLFALNLAVFGLIGLRLQRAAWRRYNEPAERRRERMADWLNGWTRRYLRTAQTVGGLRVTFQVDDSCLSAEGPFICISNHYGAIDGALIAQFLYQQYGRRDYRVVAKAETSKWPFVGPVWSILEAAFLKRDGSQADLDAIERMAQFVMLDDADIIIFPEGKVLTRSLAERGNRTLLPMRPKGFKMIANALPTATVLSFTFHWRDFAPYRLSDQGLVPPGSDVLVEVRALPLVDAPVAVLDAEWRRKAEWLQRAC